jgi:hypothetical protein
MQSKNKNKPGKVGGTPKKVGGTPKTVCRSSQKVGGTPKKVCGASKKVGGTPKTVGGASKTVGGTPKTVGGASKTVGGTPKTVGGTPKTVGGASNKVGSVSKKVRGTPKKVGGSAFEIGRMYCVTTTEDKQVSGFNEYVDREGIRLKISDASSLFIKYDNISCKKLIANASITYINEKFKNYLDNGIITYEGKSDCCYKNIKFDFFVTQYQNNDDEFANKVDKAFPGYNNTENGPKIEDCISKSFTINPCKKNFMRREYNSDILLLLNYIRTTYDDKFNNAASNKIIFQKLMPLHNYLLLDNSK